MENKRIVILGGNGDSTRIVYNYLNKHYGVFTTIIEDKENVSKFLKRRINRLGWPKVLGQILFQIVIAKPLNVLSKNRLNEIISDNQLDLTEIPEYKLKRVTSINSKESIEILKSINPDLIIVNGTRILSKKLLASVNCPFINTHAGITPKYRGVHGTYWALYNNDLMNSGVTVHFVDQGIDTGNIIYQSNVTPTAKDNFSTYPLLQLSEGLKLLDKTVDGFYGNGIVTQKAKMIESKLWYHPTIFEYLYGRLVKGIK